MYSQETNALKTFQKPLTQAEEAKYIRLLREGTGEQVKQAKEILVEHNMRLVAHIVRKYQNTDEELDDLLSIGCIGLIKAIDSFDDQKGRLATYACRCIDNELLMMLRGKKKMARDVSIYDSIGTDKEGNEIKLLDVLETPQRDYLEQIELSDDIKRLQRYFKECLSGREQEILVLRYGLGGSRAITQSQVGEKLGISRSYVSRIEKKALLKLKQRFETE